MADAPDTKNLKWLVLATVMVGTFLGRLDQTIVNLAVPSVINDFGISVSAAGWIATAYILANAVFVPVWGKLGDTIGRKRVYITGFLLFIVGSVLAGLSWDLPSLIAFRVIQAIAGSADYPTAMAILAVTFPAGRERAQALGIWSAVFGASSVFGPLIGGPLIDNFGWRSVFLVNLPVGIIGLAMAYAFVRESVSERVTKVFDWWGAITLGISLSAVVLVLDQGVSWGWLSANSLLSYAVALISFAGFLAIERRHPEPIIDLSFFKNSVFVNALGNNFITFMGLMGSIFLVPVFAQQFLGLNATETGYLFMPMAFALLAGAPLGGMLVGRVKPNYVIAASTAVGALGVFLFSGLDARSTSIDIIVPMAVMAFGLGFGMAQRTGIITTVVPAEEMGVASAILALVRNVSGAFGVAIFATVLNSAVESELLSTAAHSFVRVPSLHGVVTELVILKAQVAAYDYVFLVASLVIACGAIAALFMRLEHPETKSGEPVMIEV